MEEFNMVVPCDTVAVNHVAFKKEEKKEVPLAAPAPVVVAPKKAPKVVKPSKKNK